MEHYRNWNFRVTRAPSSRLATALSDASPGFGKHYSDHMVVMDLYADDWEDELGQVVDARILPYGEIHLSPRPLNLRVSQAAHEGLQAFKGPDGKVRLFRPKDHWHRLNVAAQRLAMPRLATEMALEATRSLLELDHGWIDAANGRALYLRPILFGDDGAWHGQSQQHRFQLMIIATQSTMAEPAPLLLYVPRTSMADSGRAFVRSSQGGVGDAKVGNPKPQALHPLQVPKKIECLEVLWTGAQEIDPAEAAAMCNVFFLIGDKVVTPKLPASVLPGITRDSVLRLLHVMGVEVEERAISFKELLSAGPQLREAFATGAACSVRSILRIDSDEQQLHLEDTSMAQRLRSALEDVRWGRVHDGFGWMHALDV